jgi:glycosyltransferase involved in cell wall biosynthesis
MPDHILCSPTDPAVFFSVIVSTCERRETLLACLDALAEQSFSADQFEVFVCDDASTDGTPEAVARWAGPFKPRCLRQETRRGPGPARNRAIALARGEYLLFLNDDAILHPEALTVHAAWHQRFADKKVSVVGRFLMDAPYDQSLFGFLLDHSTLSFRFHGLASPALYEFMMFYTFNLSVQRAAVVAAGCFDEDFGALPPELGGGSPIPLGCEDLELGYRLQRMGYSVLYASNCVARHRHDLRPSNFCRTQVGRGAGGVVRIVKHPEMISHYDMMTAQDLARLRGSLPRLETEAARLRESIDALCLGRVVDPALASANPPPMFPLSEPDPRLTLGQWRLPEEVMRQSLGAATRELDALDHRPGPAGPEILDAVCRAGLLLKWHYDTLGVVTSPWIERFIELRKKPRAALARPDIAALYERYLRDPGDGKTAMALTRALRQAGKPVEGRLLLSLYVDHHPGDVHARAMLKRGFDHFAEVYAGFPENRDTLPDGQGAPLFSVVTPSFNQARFLEDTIRSVLRQGVSSYEHIVMDGGSTDDTAEVAARHPHLRFVSEPDRGQTHALNKALRLARGEIVAWINSDDYYAPGAFAAAASAFAADPDLNMVLGGCLWVYEGSGRCRHVPGRDMALCDMVRYWNDLTPPPQPALFFRRRLLERVGYFDEDLHLTMDYDFWLRAAALGPIRGLPGLLAVYRFHGASKSGDQEDWRPFYAEWHRCYERHRQGAGLPPAPLLTVAVPWGVPSFDREDRVKGLLDRIAGDKFRDLEILIVADADAPVPQALLSGQPTPVRLERVSALTPGEFVARAARAAAGELLWFPPSGAILAGKWFLGPLNAMLDDAALAQVPVTTAPELPEHGFLPVDGPVSGRHFHRTDLIRDALNSGSSGPNP